MRKRWTVPVLLLVLSVPHFRCGTDAPVRIFLMGDSTMAEKPPEGYPERGWGQMLPEYFLPSVEIHNHARNGRSTKSFIDEGRWQTVLVALQPGDHVMIQFGHNDPKQHDPARYAPARGAFRENLQRFVSESRSRGSRPILITPVMRRRFDSDGRLYDTHGEYPDVVRDVAARMDVPLIDLHRSSRILLEDLGAEASKALFLWVEPGVYARFPDGERDNTHFSARGARTIAGLVVRGLKDLDLNLKEHLQPSPGEPEGRMGGRRRPPKGER